MPEHQIHLSLDALPTAAPEAAPNLREEIARLWALPLGEQVRVSFHPGPVDTVTGPLELTRAPSFPWDAREPLALRVAGLSFSSRDIAAWVRL